MLSWPREGGNGEPSAECVWGHSQADEEEVEELCEEAGMSSAQQKTFSEALMRLTGAPQDFADDAEDDDDDEQIVVRQMQRRVRASHPSLFPPSPHPHTMLLCSALLCRGRSSVGVPVGPFLPCSCFDR